MRTCPSHPDRKVRRRGLCGSCYERWLERRDPAYLARRRARNKAAAASVRLVNNAKENERIKQWRHAQPRDRRQDQWLRKYGLTLRQFNELKVAQDDRCKLCRCLLATRKTAHVDHKHGTKIIRGLLCHKCNMGLGLFNDDAGLLRLAASYVEKSEPVVNELRMPSGFRYRTFKTAVERLAALPVEVRNLPYSC